MVSSNLVGGFKMNEENNKPAKTRDLGVILGLLSAKAWQLGAGGTLRLESM